MNQALGQLAYERLIGSAAVTVTPGPVASVTLEPTVVAVDVGASQQFTFRALDGFGNEISDVPGLWSVPTEAGAIDSNGVLTASTVAGLFLQGIRVEVVTGEDRASDESDLAVQSGHLSTIDLTPSLIDMKKGASSNSRLGALTNLGMKFHLRQSVGELPVDL